MRYLFDRESDSLSVTFAEGRKYRDSQEISEGVVIDFDVDGKPYAIEFLRAQSLVDTQGLVSGGPVRLDDVELTPASLKRWREHLRLSQDELAARLQVSPDVIRAWESGDRAIEYAGVLGLALKAIEGNVQEEHAVR